MAHPLLGAFDQGVAPQIAIINKSTLDWGVTPAQLANALQRYVTEFFAPVWGTPATFTISDVELPRAWGLVFWDDADAAGALGYHDLTDAGLPLSKVFVRTTIQNGDKVSITAAHEVAEMLIDPGIQLWAQNIDGTLWAYETADACEAYSFDIDGVAMSDFVYPSYFESFRLPGSRKFDFMGLINRPFEILPGGYSTIMKNGQVTQIFGSQQKAEAFGREDRRGHRSEVRTPASMEGDLAPIVDAAAAKKPVQTTLESHLRASGIVEDPTARQLEARMFPKAAVDRDPNA